MSEGRALVVDDEQLICDSLTEYLQQEGFEVMSCGSGEQALALAQEHHFDVGLCDVLLPDMDGIELLDRLLKISPETSVVMITAFATVESAVEAFQRGALDYLMKPLLLEEVGGKLRRLLTLRNLNLQNQWLRRELSRQQQNLILGRSAAMQSVFELVRKVAPSRSPVLITGESGTGKELIARSIHESSPDHEKLFLPVNCAAIPQDLLENQLFGHRKGAFTGAERDEPGVLMHAGEGTVFLDEIGELPLASQAKLLRAIDQREVFPVGASEPVQMSARILSATNKDLEREVEAGRFREDLYYRLNVVSIPIPPLRERREDIPDLVEHLLARHAQEMGKRIQGVDFEAMQRLRQARWKGNVRELENVIQRAVILGEGPLITCEDLPDDLSGSQNDPTAVDDLTEAVQRFERRHLQRVLNEMPDKKEAAKRLGMSLSSLYRHIEKLGLGDRAP